MTPDDIRRLALGLPEAAEADHHGVPSFRVRGKIFCTINETIPRMMVKLDPEDQRNLTEAHPDLIGPIPGYWGRKGSTSVAYQRADEALVALLLKMSWINVAPARLKALRGGSRSN